MLMEVSPTPTANHSDYLQQQQKNPRSTATLQREHVVAEQMRFCVWAMGSWSLKLFVISLFVLHGFLRYVQLQRKWSRRNRGRQWRLSVRDEIQKKKKKKTGIKKTQRADKGNVKVFHRGLKSQCSSAPLAEGAAFLTPHLRLCFLLKLVYSLSH